MPWCEVESVWNEAVEKDLQVLIDNWLKPDASTLVGGGPQWMFDEVKRLEPRQRRHRRGYAYTPDAVWELTGDRVAVVEISSASKGDAVGLAEVLHHARVLEEDEGKRAIPVVVTSGSVWMREAARYLFEQGLERHALVHLEAQHLSYATKQVFWFESPHGPCRRKAHIPSMPPVELGSGIQVYRIEDQDTWLLSKDDKLDGVAPVRGLATPHALLTRVRNHAGMWLAWSASSSHDAGRYFLFDPAATEGEAVLKVAGLR